MSPLARRSIIVRDNTEVFHRVHGQIMTPNCGSPRQLFFGMGKSDVFTSSFMNFMYRDYGMEAVTRQKSLEQNRVAKMKQFEQVKM